MHHALHSSSNTDVCDSLTCKYPCPYYARDLKLIRVPEHPKFKEMIKFTARPTIGVNFPLESDLMFKNHITTQKNIRMFLKGMFLHSL